VNTLAVHRVKYLPPQLAPGTLYVSSEYAVAGHLCACGCGSKVITPLGPAEWDYSEHNGLPTLRPSVGNWQLPCRSHYNIVEGRILWAGAWSDAQIAAGRLAEEQRRQAYYQSMDRGHGFWRGLWNRARKFFGG
jgi:hypothetical protein